MRDTLPLPENGQLGRALRVLCFIRSTHDGGKEYYFTIHLDDVRLPGTEPFQKIPQRLDLENTRALVEGEEAVLLPGDSRIGTEPMVFSIVAPVVGVFEEVANASVSKAGSPSYQNVPAEVATQTIAPQCTCVTLTLSSVSPAPTPILNIHKLQSSLVAFLATVLNKTVYTTLYSHAPDAQPAMLPKMADGQHGKGDWVICILVEGDADERLLEAGFEGVDGQVGEWFKRVKLAGSVEGLEVNIGVWRGDVFMS